MMTIEQIDATQAATHINQLMALLQNVVDDGASIGFIAPLPLDEAQAYWQGVFPAVAEGNKILLMAWQGNQLVGSVQLAMEPRRNGRHRAEVQKLMVHTSARGHGLGRQLMTEIERLARVHERSLIVLDTRCGDVADGLYQRLGYTQVGIIPNYAMSSAGHLTDTVFYYREL